MDLKKWSLEYIKHKDAFLKQIQQIDEKPDGYHIRFKAKEESIICNEDLGSALARVGEAKHASIYCVNTRSNFEILTTRWHTLATNEGLTIFFINPDSQTETKWVIRPHLHNRIADEESLKTGLRAMFDTVEEYKG
jgi:hypothetical protein